MRNYELQNDGFLTNVFAHPATIRTYAKAVFDV